MAYKELNMWVDSSKYQYKCPRYMTPIGICVHNTANDAPAKNEASYMRSNYNKVSFHDAVDHQYVVHCIPHTRNAYHAGDGGNGLGNTRYIGIEICYSKSGGKKFDQAEINAAIYIASLLKENNWGIEKVKRHKDFSGKYCPHRTLDYGWKRFLNMVQAELDKLNTGTNVTKPVTSASTESKKLVVDGSWGKSTTRITQKVLKCSSRDGIVSNQPTSNKKYLEACQTASWQFKGTNCKGGSAMIKKIQKLVGATADGLCGKQTVIAIQKFLNKKGFKCGTADGYMGAKTVKAWQKYINSRVK